MLRRQFLNLMAGVAGLSTAACAKLPAGSPAASAAGRIDPGRVLYTFDDVPLEYGETIALTDILRANGAAAQFYLTGEGMLANPVSVQHIIDEGYPVGWHSMRHHRMSGKTDRELARDIREWKKALRVVAPGYEPTLARFPHGDGRFEQFLVLNHEGLHIQPCSWGGHQAANWDVDTFDWNPFKCLDRQNILNKIAEAQAKYPETDTVLLFHLNLNRPIRFSSKSRQMSDNGDVLVTTSAILDDLKDFENILA